MFKFFRRLISTLILLALVVPGYALFVTWSAAHTSTVEKVDAIVVPGAAQLDGKPGEVLLARLQEAKRLYIAGQAPLIITVGSGAPGDRTTEADSGRRWLIEHGISRKEIISIAIGRDTQTQTQQYVQEMKARKLARVVIATDPYHCKRAITMAQDLGVSANCSPVSTGPNSLAHPHIRYLVREAGAYLAYISLGRRGIHISDHVGNNQLVRYVHGLSTI